MACEFVRQRFRGPEPVQLRRCEPKCELDDGSWNNLIWFAEIDDEKSLKAFVEEALQQVDCKRQAQRYWI